jgi:hypothetical protein
MTERPLTIVLILDEGQIKTLREDLNKSMERGAGTVFLVMSEDKEIQDKISKAKHGSVELDFEELFGQASITAAHDTLFTLAFEHGIEYFLTPDPNLN